MGNDHVSDGPDSEYLHVLECMDRINRAIQGANNLNEMMRDVLDEVLAMFDCDRASLVYPCDPHAAAWQVPMERSKPEYPGMFTIGKEIPMVPEVAAIYRVSLDEKHPIAFGIGTRLPIPHDIQAYGDKSGIGMSLFPRTGKPWEFTIVQCSRVRQWRNEELRLFEEIGHRLDDALTSMLIMRELQESETKFRRFVETSNEGVWAVDSNYQTTFVNTHMAEMLGYAVEDLVGHPITDFILEEDLPSHRQKTANRKKHRSEVYERRFRHKDGGTVWTLISATPILDERDVFCGAITMLADITTRKQTEKVIQEKQELLLETQRIAHMGSWHMDLKTNEVFWSEELYKMYGYDPTLPPPIYTESAKLFTPESWEHLSSAIAQAVETGTPYEIELEMMPRAAGSKWMLARGELVRDAQGKPVRLRGVVLDITERKRNEAINASRLHLVHFSLAHSLDELLEETLNEAEKLTGSRIGFYHFVEEDQITLRLQNWSTRTKAKFCKAEGEGLHYPIDEAGVWVDCVRQGKPVVHNDYTSLPHRKGMPDGHAEVVRELVVPVFRGKKITAILGVGNKPFEYTDEDIHTISLIADLAWEIAERKIVEEKLQHSQTRLAEAQRTAKLGNWELNLRTDELVWSDEAHDIFEIDKQHHEDSHEAFLAAIHPEDRDMVTHAHAGTAESQGGYEIGYRLQMRDGRVKFVQEQGRINCDNEGRPMRLVGTVQDISHLHEIEEQLHQAQKMEAIGTLVGGIAHDFNNKLAAITGNLYMAQRGTDIDSKTAARLKVVEKLSFEAAKMVQQLLTFARKGKVEQTPITLVPFIKETAKLNRLAIPEDIAFSVEHGKDPLPIMGDITQLQQLFLNLLTNARDALEGMEHGHIDVSLQYYAPDTDFRIHHPEAANTKAFARMQVRDNGQGIAPEHLEQIFDPFFTTKEVGKGTGLGLAMVYGVVQSHRGIIEVESSPGKGTCFSVYLPLHSDSGVLSASNEHKEIVEGRGETILLADDDANVLGTFADMLTSIQYRVLTARNGREAIELFRQHATEIDLVILDIVMPEMKGPQVAERIREIDPDAKVILATGYDSSKKNTNVTDNSEILKKPFTMDSASRIIRKKLDQHHRADTRHRRR